MPIRSRPPKGMVRDARGHVPLSANRDPVYVEMVASVCSSTREMKSALALIGTDRARKFMEQLVRLEQRGPTNSSYQARQNGQPDRSAADASLRITQAAKSAGIGIDEFADMWRSAAMAKAMLKIISATPQIAADVIEAASNYTTVCSSCLGEGKLLRRDDSELLCPQCNGTGAIRRAGDRDAREHMLEWAGVINQGNKNSQAPAGGVFLSLVLPRGSDKLDQVTTPATVDIKQIPE